MSIPLVTTTAKALANALHARNTAINVIGMVITPPSATFWAKISVISADALGTSQALAIRIKTMLRDSLLMQSTRRILIIIIRTVQSASAMKCITQMPMNWHSQ